ncbi:discoidin domain-containing protein, partial [Paenibacillus sinopodophylli]|uniref:discoidin domain-containing protein n=1 Tax=Paenibacillus sinopodophylli TaxID=1837342 RepID=UPI0014865039
MMKKRFMREMIAMFLIVLLGMSFLEAVAAEVINETVIIDAVANVVDSQDDAIKILMVGNSLTRYNSVADKLVQLFAYAGKQAKVDTRTQMGASLIDQAEILATSTRDAIVYGDYDYIVLQEKSSGFTEALLMQGVGAFDPWIQEAESHPQLVLYMPWANEDVFKTMQTTFTNAYVKVAKDYGALLAPSGEAYYDLYFNEGKDWYRNGDNVHGNDLASLISASTLFYAMSGQEQPVLQIREEDQSVVKALVESSDYRNYPVNYDRDLVNLIERKANAFTNTYRNLNNVPDLTGRGIDATVNLAKQKQGSASSNARGATRGIGARNVANLTDGSYTSFITLHEADPDPWFAVDLGVQTAFNQLTLYWGGTGDYVDSYKTKFTVEGTNDPNAGYKVITAGESTSTNKQEIRFPSVEYQYVRVYVTEKNGAYASLYEMEIYNLPGQGGNDDPATDFEVNVGDYLQVQVGDILTNMSLYEQGMYESVAAFPQGVKDYKILSNGESIYKGAITESNVAQNIIIRLFATDNKVVTGQDVHKDVNGNPVQDIKKVANWTGNFFNRTGIEEFKAFGGWDQASPLSTLNYLGGGIFARELTYTVPEASVSYDYKINFDRTWNNGEIPSANRKVVFPASEKETDTFVLWVNSVRGDIFDSLTDGSTTFKIKGNDKYMNTIGIAKVGLSLSNEGNETLYQMIQTGKDAYMVTAFIEPGTYIWADKIDDKDGTLSGDFTVDKNTAVTFYYHVNEADYVLLNTVNNAEGFFEATIDDPDMATVAAAVAALEVGYAAGNNAAVVTQNVTLPTTGLNDVTVSWSSDNSGIIRTNGEVVRPLAGAADAVVTLTATLTKGQVTDTRSFTMIVKSMEIEAIPVETIQ